jgi:hypothetical protein
MFAAQRRLQGKGRPAPRIDIQAPHEPIGI